VEPTPDAAQPEKAALAPKPVAEPAPVVAGASARFPDGSTMPALNGVKTDVVIQWGSSPFTKIIGTEDGPGGWKWYVHENGTRSTTAMVDQNGVPTATSLVAEPTAALPTGMEANQGGGSPAGGNPPSAGGKK